MYELEVVNPVSPQRGEVSAFPYAPRPSSLKDKVIGLMWNGNAWGRCTGRRMGTMHWFFGRESPHHGGVSRRLMCGLYSGARNEPVFPNRPNIAMVRRRMFRISGC